MASPEWSDWVEIVGALNRFGAILDAREWDRIEEVITPDAVLYGQQGAAAIVDNNLRHYLGGCGPSQHLLGNYDVAIDGDVATSNTLVRAYHRGAGDRADKWFESYGVYHDRWRRTADGWRMTNREMEITANVGDISVLQPG